MDPVFHPMKERRPWLCSKCKWHIFLGSKNCCPLCDEKLFDFAVPSKDLQYSQEKERKEVFEIQPSLWKVADVLNVGQIKQKRGQGLKPKQEGAIRFVCVSDTHSRQREIQNDIPDGDVFIHAGSYLDFFFLFFPHFSHFSSPFLLFFFVSFLVLFSVLIHAVLFFSHFSSPFF